MAAKWSLNRALEKARALMGKPCKAARYGDAMVDGQRRFIGAMDLLEAGAKAGLGPAELAPLTDFLAHHLDQWPRVLGSLAEGEVTRGFWMFPEVDWARLRSTQAAHDLRWGWRPLHGRATIPSATQQAASEVPTLHPTRADWRLLRGVTILDPPPEGKPWRAPEGAPPEAVEYLLLSGSVTARRGVEMPRWTRLKALETRHACLSLEGLEALLGSLPDEGLVSFEMEAVAWEEEELRRLAQCAALRGVRALGLGWGSWSKEGARALAKAPWLASVERLSVSSMSRSAGATLDLLREGDWANLKALELDATALTPKQLDALLECLRHRGLRILTLRWSKLPPGAQRSLACAQGLEDTYIFLNHSPLRRERWLKPGPESANA